MNLSTEKFSREIQKILDEDGISPEQLANLAKIHYSTIYRILHKEKPTAQRGIAKQIAEATNRTFKIVGDKVEFFKIEKADDNLNEVEKEMLEIFRRQNRTKQRMLVNLMELVCNLKGGDEEKGHSSNN